MARLLRATTTVKYQAALSVAYGAGLRVAEVAALKITDVDSERMLLRVERGNTPRNSLPSTRTGSATKCAHGQVAAITAPSPASAKIPNPHRPTPARRGFVPPRLSYAFGARNAQGKANVTFGTTGGRSRRTRSVT